MGLPEIDAVLGAGIHKSRVGRVQQLGRPGLMSIRWNRVGRYSDSDRSREGGGEFARVRCCVFAKLGPRWRRRDQERRGVSLPAGRPHQVSARGGGAVAQRRCPK